MSLVICCRMISYIASFEDDIFEVVNQNIGDGNRYDDDKPVDEYDEPMPIGLLQINTSMAISIETVADKTYNLLKGYGFKIDTFNYSRRKNSLT